MAVEKNSSETTNKNDRIYVRLNEQIKRDFEIIAAYRGLKTSALIHSLIVQTIHKAKEEKPELFDDAVHEKRHSRLSEKLIAQKSGGQNKTFTTGDGRTIPLVDEGTDGK